MADERLPKRAAELREQGSSEETREAKTEMGGLCMLKERCEEYRRGGDWKKKTGDRGEWRRIADEAVKKLQAAPHRLTPDKGKKRKREN